MAEEEKHHFFSLQLPKKREKPTGFVIFAASQPATVSHEGLCKKRLKSEVVFTFLCEALISLKPTNIHSQFKIQSGLPP